MQCDWYYSGYRDGFYGRNVLVPKERAYPGLNCADSTERYMFGYNDGQKVQRSGQKPNQEFLRYAAESR